MVERWTDSCALLDCHVPLLAGPWAAQTSKYQQGHGSENYKDEERRVRAQAMQDPVVLQALAVDILIYNVTLRHFETQVGDEVAREYGVAFFGGGSFTNVGSTSAECTSHVPGHCTARRDGDVRGKAPRVALTTERPPCEEPQALSHYFRVKMPRSPGSKRRPGKGHAARTVRELYLRQVRRSIPVVRRRGCCRDIVCATWNAVQCCVVETYLAAAAGNSSN